MLEIPVYNTSGEKVDTLKVDEAVFGGWVNVPLLKQAVVAYHANRRQGTSCTRSRGLISGSTRKLFRQKGTGNARRGAVRSSVVRGGGVTFAKTNRDFRKRLPKKMRQAALNSAILTKIVGGNLLVLDGLKLDKPRTREIASMLEALDLHCTCLLAMDKRNQDVYLSCRNIADVNVRIVDELNAFDVMTRKKMLVTSQAMRAMIGQEVAS